MAKDEDNGDGTFDRYTDSKSWNSSLTFADFGNYNLKDKQYHHPEVVENELFKRW